MHVIYKITNLINDKVYIGKTKNPRKRWLTHKRKTINGKSRLSNALRKYGIEHFMFEEILYVLSNEKEIVNFYERMLIAEYRSTEKIFGYNITEGGDGGYISDEHYLELAKKRKGKTYEELFGVEKAQQLKADKTEHILQNPIHIFQTKEGFEKISKTLKQKWQNDLEFRERMTKINKEKAKSGVDHHHHGKTHIEEYGQDRAEKISKAISKSRLNKTYEDIYGRDIAERLKQEKRTKYSGKGNPNYKFVDLIKIFEILINDPRTVTNDLLKFTDICRISLTKKLKNVINEVENYFVTNFQHFRESKTDEELVVIFKKCKDHINEVCN